MFDVALTNFRGFKNQDFISVRPITLLIGENSAGKSSFLAALKYMSDLVSGDEVPSFNKDPFQLGTFQQIAHYRGGKAGRAKSIEISIRRQIKVRRDRSSSEVTSAIFRAKFHSSNSDVLLNSISVETSFGSIVSSIGPRRFAIRLVDQDGQSQDLDETSEYPRAFRLDFARYWQILLRDLRFRINRRADRDLVGKQSSLFDEGQTSLIAYLSSSAERLARSFPTPVSATSAIRTKPLRTYTPGTDSPDGEGSHVPFALAKMFRSDNKSEWLSLKNDLERFGQSSGMFREVGIKSFGQSLSDPFQLHLSLDGPKTNIVDLGYGTSQIIPIIYNVSSWRKGGMHLIQQPEVHLHPKAQAALGDYFVESFIEKGSYFVLETHSDFIVDRVRQAIQAKKIKSSDVSILFFERSRLENRITEIVLGEDGEPVDPPATYRDFFVNEVYRNLGVSVKSTSMA